MSKLPIAVYGNDELAECREVVAGDTFVCSRCGQTHELTAAIAADGRTNDVLLFYRCGADSYVGAVANRLVAERA